MFSPVNAITSAMEPDLRENEFRRKPSLGEVRGDSLLRFFRRNLWVEEYKNRRAGSAESSAEDAGVTGEFLDDGKQRRERRTIGLMNSVFESCGQQVGTILSEGREQQHRVLNIGDSVGPRILKGQHAARLLGRKRSIGNG